MWSIAKFNSVVMSNVFVGHDCEGKFVVECDYDWMHDKFFWSMSFDTLGM